MRLLKKFFSEYHAQAAWDPRRTERASVVLPLVLDHVQGDILEIGAHCGLTTQVFCKLGAERGRHVIVVDPWDGRQEGNDRVFQEFKGNTQSCVNLTVHHMGSEDPNIRNNFLDTDKKFAFILIDGLHTYEGVKNDIEKYVEFLTPNGVLCIDDWRGPYPFCARIRESTRDHLGDGFAEIQTPDTFIENYFVKLPEEA